MVKILIISQGGKVTSSFETRQYVPDSDNFEIFLRSTATKDNVSYDFMSIKEDVSGINSCQPEDCNALGKIIEKNYDDYDGFFILRGSNFSDYVGASLAFSLRGNHKPILIGDAEGSFDNPITNVRPFLMQGLHYLNSLGQVPKRRSDVCILSDGIIVKAVDATLFPDGTGRYYSRTGNNFHVEQLHTIKSDNAPKSPRNDIKRIPINESLNILMHNGLSSFGDEFNMLAQLEPDAIILTTNPYGQFTEMQRGGIPTMFELSQKDIPLVITATLPHSPVRIVFNETPSFIEGGTMSTNVALAKTRYALTVSKGNIEGFRAIMLEDLCGEIPSKNALITAIRPEFPNSGRGRAYL